MPKREEQTIHPDITWIYMTWHYTNSRDLTLHEFIRPDFTRIYLTWHYTNLRDVTTWIYTNLRYLTLHEFTRSDFTWIYTNLRYLTLHEFTWPDITRIYATCHYRYILANIIIVLLFPIAAICRSENRGDWEKKNNGALIHGVEW